MINPYTWLLEITTTDSTLAFSVSQMQMKNKDGQISITSIDNDTLIPIDIEFATLRTMQNETFHFTGMIKSSAIDYLADHEGYIPVSITLSPHHDSEQSAADTTDDERSVSNDPVHHDEADDSDEDDSFAEDYDKLMKIFDEKIKGKEFIYDKTHDGSEGVFIETLFDKRADNLAKPDWNSIEFKSRRASTNSMITLFSKSPVNGNLIRKKYGKTVLDENGEPYKRLNATIGSNEYTKTKSNPYNFKIEMDDVKQRLLIKVADAETGLPVSNADDAYWDYSEIKKSMSKIKNLALFNYTNSTDDNGNSTITVDNLEVFHFDFPMFKELIATGGIKVEIRMGMYRTGSKKGQLHDHGTAFRVCYPTLKKVMSKKRL